MRCRVEPMEWRSAHRHCKRSPDVDPPTSCAGSRGRCRRCARCSGRCAPRYLDHMEILGVKTRSGPRRP
eukprot:scaffold320952_cov30-Tisochrysis_lutea.AAC.4